VKVGDLPIATTLDIERALLDVRAGQKASVVVRRGGEEKVVSLEPQPVTQATLASATTAAPATAGVADPTVEQLWRRTGLRVVPVAREYVKAVSPSFRGGLYVQAVQPGSPAAAAAIQKGDILVGMNAGDRDWETIRPDNVLFILNQPDVQQSQALQFYLVRKNEFVQGQLTLGDAPAAALRR
jgi:serine protease Do